ncbi:hypothetical protein LCGC14_2520290, partial [marine sediment metagenome]
LYRSLRRQGITIGPDDLPATNRALDALEKRLTPFANLEEAGKVITLIKSMRENLNAGDIDFETLSIFRKIIGNQIGKFEAAGGVRLGAGKKLFRSLLNDVERLAAKKPATEGSAALFKAAPERAKLEFAVQDLEALVARYTKTVSGEGGTEALNAGAILTRLKKIINPKDDLFDKNFTVALKDHLPGIIRFFEKANELEKAKTFGPGGLIVAGRFARLGTTVLGTLTGGAMGGQFGATAGALLGVQAPEYITAALMTKTGQAFVRQALIRTTGPIDMVLWTTLAQMGRGLVEGEVKEEIGAFSEANIGGP